MPASLFSGTATGAVAESPAAPINWAEVKRDVASRLDVAAEFAALGVQFTRALPDAKGKRECRSIDRPDAMPSAFVNVLRAVYFDSGSGEKGLHLFDFALKVNAFGRWYDAARHYADKAGVPLGRVQAKPGGRIIEAAYDYTRPDGSIAYRVFRYITPAGGKTFTQHPPDGRGGWKVGAGCMDGVDPLPYRLPELLAADEDDPVFICEGEKACEAVVGLGLVATTAHGGSANADKAWPRIAHHLAGRDCFILPDNDHPGLVAASKVANQLAGVARSVKVVTLPDLPPKGDAVEWIADGGSAEELGRLAHAAPAWDPKAMALRDANGASGAFGAGAQDGAAPAYDPDETPISVRQWPAPPDEPAWYGPAGDFARAVEPYTEADPIGVLAQFLVGFGNLIGRNAFFEINSTRHYLNLFCCTAGSTAVGRKGTAWDIVRSGLAYVDPDFAMHRITSGLSSGEGLVWEVRDKVEAEEEVRQPGKPSTREMVVKDPGVSDKRLLVIETELGGTLKVMTREGNTLSSLVRQAWDSGVLRTLTKNNPNRATDAHVSIIGHVTEYEVTKYLSHNEASNGFANRFLWLVVRQSKLLPDGAAIPSATVRPILDRVAEAARFAIDPLRMERDPAVRDFWHATYAELSRPKIGLIGSITSRAIPYVMRLACLYALLDLSAVVRLEHLRAGLALWQYCDRSASFIFGGSLGDKDADKLVAALKATPKGLSRAEIRSTVFGRHKSSEDIAAILARLQEIGLVESERVATGGRTATIWRAK